MLGLMSPDKLSKVLGSAYLEGINENVIALGDSLEVFSRALGDKLDDVGMKLIKDFNECAEVLGDGVKELRIENELIIKDDIKKIRETLLFDLKAELTTHMTTHMPLCRNDGVVSLKKASGFKRLLLSFNVFMLISFALFLIHYNFDYSREKEKYLVLTEALEATFLSLDQTLKNQLMEELKKQISLKTN